MWETSQKRPVIIIASILTLKKLKHPYLHKKVALLMRRRCEWGTRNYLQRNFRKVWTIANIYRKYNPNIKPEIFEI